MRIIPRIIRAILFGTIVVIGHAIIQNVKVEINTNDIEIEVKELFEDLSEFNIINKEELKRFIDTVKVSLDDE